MAEGFSKAMAARDQDGRDRSLLVTVSGSSLVLSLDGANVIVRGEECWKIEAAARIARAKSERHH